MKGVKQYLTFDVLVRKLIFIFLDPLSQFNNSRILSTATTTVKAATAEPIVTTETTSRARKVILATVKRTATMTEAKTKSAAIKTTTEGRTIKTGRNTSTILKSKVIIVLVVALVAIVISPTVVGYLWWKR